MRSKRAIRRKKATRLKRPAAKKLAHRSVPRKLVSARVAGGSSVIQRYVSPESSRSIRTNAKTYSKALEGLARR
jgi:hypothetical protein